MDLTWLKSKVSAENLFLTFLTSRSCLHCLVCGHITLTSDSIVMSFLNPPSLVMTLVIPLSSPG